MRIGGWAVLPLAVLAPLAIRSANQANQDIGVCVAPPPAGARQMEEQAQKGGSATPERVSLKLEGFQTLGSKNAPITVVEFTDYQCPFCQRFHATVFHELKKNYIDTGAVRFSSRDMPLDQAHPDAIRAAQAGRCAAEQGQFWELREIIGSNPGNLDRESLVADAASLKLDVDAFHYCLASQKYAQAVQSDVLEAMRIGVEATPAFVVGKTTPSGVDGELLIGAQSLSDFVKAFAKVQGAK